MNDAVAARPSSSPNASTPSTTKMPMPARALRASLRWRSRRRLRASPGSGPWSSRARRRRPVRHGRPPSARPERCRLRRVDPASARPQSRAPRRCTAPDRARAACRAPPRLRPCLAAPVPSCASPRCVLCALIAAACGAKPEPTSGKLDTTYPASVRDGSGRIITVEAPPRLVLVVTGGPERLLARLGVRAAIAPAGRHGGARRGRASRPRGRRAGHHGAGRAAQRELHPEAHDDARVRDAGRAPRRHRARGGGARRAHESRRGGPRARALAAPPSAATSPTGSRAWLR